MNALLFEDQKRFEKLAANSIYLSLALVIFSGQGLFLNNSMLAYSPTFNQTAFLAPSVQFGGVPPSEPTEINLAKEKKEWETSVRQKYRNTPVSVVEPGIVHVRLTKYINSKPIRINIVEVNRTVNPNIELTPALASTTLAKKATVKNIAKRNNSVVAVNGTFFKPQTGVPLGALMIDRQLVTSPVYNRVAMGIGKSGFQMAKLELDAKIVAPNKQIPLDNINQPRMSIGHTIAYTRDWGQYSPPTPKREVQIAVEDSKIINISNGSIAIPKDGYVISGPKEKLEPFFNAKSVQLDIKTKPNWDDVDDIISGGPYLVKEGKVYVDVAEQKLRPIEGKNPRTAIGYTKDNNFIIVTVDGRESASVGMNIYDLAKFMKSIGCYNAMNLDGGGSSTMCIKGQVVNNPVQRGGIAISNALTVSVAKGTIAISYRDEDK